MAAEFYVCHDLKTGRGEVSSGLPAGYKLIPIAFYVAAMGCALAMGWFEWERSKAVVEARNYAAQGATYSAEAARVARDRTRVESLNRRAEEVAKWVEGALNLQPVCVTISRAAGADASIEQLSLTRNPQLPDQVRMELKMAAADSATMDAILQGIRSLDFRPYSAQQSTEGEQLDYRATLVWQNAMAVAAAEAK